MSLILDALQKADKERQDGEYIPSIESPHASPEPVKTTNWTVLGMAFGGALIVLIAAVFVFTQFSATPEHTSAPTQAQAETQRSFNHAEPMTKADVSPKQNANPSRTAASQLKPDTTVVPPVNTDMRKPQQPNRVAPPKPRLSQADALIAAQYEDKPAQASEHEQDIAPLYADENKAKAQQASEEEAQRQRALAQAQAQAQAQAHQRSLEIAAREQAARNKALAEQNKALSTQSKAQSAPKASTTSTKSASSSAIDPKTLAAYKHVDLIKALPFSAQENIPTLMYGGHQYRENGRSSVIINGQTVYENGSLGSGITLKTILKDGILARYANYEFKMIALNSWLNY